MEKVFEIIYIQNLRQFTGYLYYSIRVAFCFTKNYDVNCYEICSQPNSVFVVYSAIIVSNTNPQSNHDEWNGIITWHSFISFSLFSYCPYVITQSLYYFYYKLKKQISNVHKKKLYYWIGYPKDPLHILRRGKNKSICNQLNLIILNENIK